LGRCDAGDGAIHEEPGRVAGSVSGERVSERGANGSDGSTDGVTFESTSLAANTSEMMLGLLAAYSSDGERAFHLIVNGHVMCAAGVGVLR
jgi:hypothetical protein